MKARTEKQKTWQHHIDAWRASGQSQAGYCREHNLKSHQFIYWRSKFGAKDGQSRQVCTRTTPNTGFIIADIEPPTTQTALTIRLPNGIRLEGINTANAELSRQLIEVLK